LHDVKAEHTFVLEGHRHLRNLTELSQALATMSDAIFHHHVNEHKNDFAAWVSHCIKDKYLAEKLEHTNKKDVAARMVNERIDELTHQRSPGEKLGHTLNEPSATDHIIREIEMLSRGISEERFLTTLASGNFNASVGPRTTTTDMKESDAAFFVLQKKGTVMTNQPLQSLENTAPQQIVSTNSIYSRLNALTHSIKNGHNELARVLYTDLKQEYETTTLDPVDQKAIFTILKTAYNGILDLENYAKK
jgi:hypothetical protein